MKYSLLCSLATLLVAFNIAYATVTEEEVKMTYKQSISLNCSDIAADTFYSINKGGAETIIENKAGKYSIANNDLVITDLRKADLAVNYGCNSTNDLTVKIFKTKAQPFFFAQEKSSITVSEAGSAKFECKMITGSDNGQNVTWTWQFNGVTLEPNEKYVMDNNNENGTLTVKNAKLTDKGNYTCISDNSFGTYQQTTELRVKGALAALWPFLGIVIEVIILSLIIIIYEKKFNKKSSDDETEQSSRLVDSKDGNNDLKKRNVKA